MPARMQQMGCSLITVVLMAWKLNALDRSAGLSTPIHWPTARGRQQQQPSAETDDEARRQQPQQTSPG